MVRIKKKFLVFQIKLEDQQSNYSPEPGEITSALGGPFTDMFGDYGAGSVLPMFRTLFWIKEKRLGVFRIPHPWLERFLIFIGQQTFLNGINVKFVIHHVSSTIDQAQRWIDENNYVFNT